VGAWWRARSKRTQAILVLVGLFLVYAVVAPKSPTPTADTSATATNAAAAPTGAATASATPTPVRTTAAPTPTPAPTPFNFGSGKKIVPDEVPPGTYRMRTASAGCYFERLSGLGGTFGEIISNGNPAGPEIVTVLPTDKAFNSTRCAPWSVDLSAITTNPAADFGAGTFQVGVDIAPGTWRSSGGTSCYWQRMSGFTHAGISEIIANDNAGASTLVSIAASDKGFSSSRCGTWTKIG
jgi:hypothetical protein